MAKTSVRKRLPEVPNFHPVAIALDRVKGELEPTWRKRRALPCSDGRPIAGHRPTSIHAHRVSSRRLAEGRMLANAAGPTGALEDRTAPRDLVS